MQFGHFDDAAREYVITRPDTPRPWSNYLGSTEYGAIITNHAGGYSFYKSALNHRFLRFRSNQVPLDQPGRYFYLRDRDDGDYWSASWQPVGKPLDRYESVCRHGTGYTTIRSRYRDVETESTYFVPLGRCFEVWQLSVKNLGAAPRRLSVYTYCEFTSTGHLMADLTNLQYSQFIAKAEMREGMLAIASHPHDPFDPERLGWPGRYFMKVLGAPVVQFETLRENFIGPYGGYGNPRALLSGELENFATEGENAVGVQRVDLELAPGAEQRLAVLLGLGTPESHGLAAAREFEDLERLEQERARLVEHWHVRLDAVVSRTPDPEFDSMVNVWNAYNALITYSWSRSASLVYNGERDGLGFRDTVQDFLGVIPLLGKEVRPRLELMLTGQVQSGGAIPVIKTFEHRPGAEPTPPDEVYRSDDCLWFFDAVPAYVAETGEVDFYDQVLPYADHGEATVLGHLRRALEFNLERTGKNGLPSGLAADWNDCCNLGYTGESVMVAFQVRRGLGVYAEIATHLGRAEEARWALARRDELDEKLQAVAWDGDWFIWATGKDGTVYGTKAMAEGQLYLNTQVWAVISGAASPEQGERAMQSVHERLATPYGLMLSAPPFERTPRDVMGGVIFNKGIKENGGIFNHPQAWAVMADCLLEHPDRAYETLRAYLPAAYNTRAEVREVEPYVHSQTTYAEVNSNRGKSRVPWLTGTASWTAFVAVQFVLGLRPELGGLRIDPSVPSRWPGFRVERRLRGHHLSVDVDNRSGAGRGVRRVQLGETFIEGNLVPYDRLAPGARLRVVLEG